MTKQTAYQYPFSNGVIKIEKLKFDWLVSVELTPKGDVKRFITLNQRIFLTRKHALATTQHLLTKYELI